ncbi:MAG TPA: ATP-binding protein [Conexibacter sp.]|nr:ATP-binding protein [Conexibacter sp.]
MSQPRDRPPLVSRLTVSRWFTFAASALAFVTVIAVVLGVVAITRLSAARTLVIDRNGPAVLAALRLSNALLDQETGVRGYALTGNESFLAPYRDGLAVERVELAQFDKVATIPELAQARRDVAAVKRSVAAWRRTYVAPTIASVRAGSAVHDTGMGKRGFDRVRAAVAQLQANLDTVRLAGRRRFKNAAEFLSITFGAIALLMALGITGVVIALRITVSRPLRRVGRQVRRTARGEFDEPIVGDGPRDIVGLTQDVDSMRRRIVQELSDLRAAHARLDEQARELQRSNAELEQFAYVASHDLQEPLRKITSFCQLLEQRYDAQLDARGRQYIGFAVDGAKRMQQLINDLLAFSRVGHGAASQPVVACDELLQLALTSLAAAIEESGAEIVTTPLPSVRGEPALLAAVFQNLVGNALKFHGELPPRIELGAEREGDHWLFTCTDAGIGIDPEYAERVFTIFQRLHPKDAYAGTGIGLALCRKIVERLGGRIWLDTSVTDRTMFRFTLPAIEETQ